MAAVAVTSQYLSANAWRMCKSSLVAILNYTGVVFAFLVDYFFFDISFDLS